MTSPKSSYKGGGASAAEVRRVALDLLARREHSALELRHKLQRRGFAAGPVEAVLAALIGEGLLDEARYAEVYSCARLDKGYGPLRIRQELRERGVSEAIVAAILADLDAAWMTHLARVHRKRFGEAPPDEMAERARRMRFLRQRGFTLEQIDRLFRNP